MAEVQDDFLAYMQPAEFRGVFWYAERATTSGGRKTVLHRFVKSDRQLVEDLGLDPDAFTLSGMIAATPSGVGRGGSKTYPEAKAALLEALRSGEGPAVLVHPFTGRLENIVALDWTLDENTKRAGTARISIRFAVSDTDGVPREFNPVINNVEVANEAVTTAVQQDVTTRFFRNVERLADGSLKQVGRFTQTFSDSVDKVVAYTAAVRDATDPFTQLADQVDSFSNGLDTISNEVFSLVDNPADLSDALLSVNEAINALYATPEATLAAFQNLFNFGDDDIDYGTNTASRAQRQVNRDVLNGAVQAQALGYAYLNASLADYVTTNEIDEVAALLEDQFQVVTSAGAIDRDTSIALSNLRNTTNRFFDRARITKPNVVVTTTARSAARVLSFAYYGTSELGEAIVGLNDLTDPSFVPSGDVAILSV